MDGSLVWKNQHHQSGTLMPLGAVHPIIASEAKQSIAPKKASVDCFASLVMTRSWHFRALAEPLLTPFHQLGADLIRLLLLRPMAAAANQIFLQVGHDLFRAVGP